MTNNKIVLASITVIVAAGLLSLNPSIIGNAGAQMYGVQYGYDSNYYKDDNRYGYDNNHEKKSSHEDIQKISCVNSNINVNGIDITQIPHDETATAAAIDGTAETPNTQQNSNGLADKINIERNLVNICANVNSNNQAKGPATLTINKEVFGCTRFNPQDMNCQELQNDSPSWLPCIGSTISTTDYCLRLPPNLFDIEVLDVQNTQIQQFEGSTAGITIQNLQPGTYTVNEIKHPSNTNQLGENAEVQQECTSVSFVDGGILDSEDIQKPGLIYNICFEYEDEQGNDCSTVTLAAGEDKTCTVKNYISFARFV
jgi:hypothetical protein